MRNHFHIKHISDYIKITYCITMDSVHVSGTNSIINDETARRDDAFQLVAS